MWSPVVDLKLLEEMAGFAAAADWRHWERAARLWPRAAPRPPSSMRNQIRISEDDNNDKAEMLSHGAVPRKFAQRIRQFVQAHACGLGLGRDLGGQHADFMAAAAAGLGVSATKLPRPCTMVTSPSSSSAGIGALHGVEIDRQRHRHFAHGGKLRARLKFAASDGGGDLVAQLHIDGNAIVLKSQPAQHGMIV